MKSISIIDLFPNSFSLSSLSYLILLKFEIVILTSV